MKKLLFIFLILASCSIFSQSTSASFSEKTSERSDKVYCQREANPEDLLSIDKKRLTPLGGLELTDCQRTVLSLVDLSKLPNNLEFVVFNVCRKDDIAWCFAYVGLGERKYDLNQGVYSRTAIVPSSLSPGLAIYSDEASLEQAKVKSIQSAIAYMKKFNIGYKYGLANQYITFK